MDRKSKIETVCLALIIIAVAVDLITFTMSDIIDMHPLVFLIATALGGVAFIVLLYGDRLLDNLPLPMERSKAELKEADSTSYIEKAKKMREAGGIDSAIERLETMCRKFPDAEQHILLAEQYAAANETDNALINYRKAISLDSRCAYANIGAGKCMLEKGDPFAARSFISKGIDLMPQTDTYYGEAQAYYALACAGCEDMTEAQRALRRAEAAGYAECEKIRAQIGTDE